MIIYYNKKFVVDGQIISPCDRGFTLGDGIFDTLLACKGVIENAPEHFQRLNEHAAALEIKVDLSFEQWQKAIDRILYLNNLKNQACSIRTTITRGIASRGLAFPRAPKTTTLIQASILESKNTIQKTRALIFKEIRRNEYSFLSKIKALNYSENIMALQRAKREGFDDAILLNTKGLVACSTTANIFIYKNNKLFTPRLEDGVVNGITRKIILNKFNTSESAIEEEQLFSADCIFLTNSLNKLRIVTQLNEIPLLPNIHIVEEIKKHFYQ